MKVILPQYSSKDYVVLPIVVIPFTLLLNYAILGIKYFDTWKIFILTSLITAGTFSLFFILCGGIAVAMRRRFPDERDVIKRLLIVISAFLTMTGIVLLILFKGYEQLPISNFTFNATGFVWSYVGFGIINIFLTFLFEGIARFDKWKANFEEAKELRKTYLHSQLQGLKSQVNPHFLFNSLNSLSSLISEEGDDAEKFLDELSKVYRYLLRGDQEHLVALSRELQFLESYLHLLNVRFGHGLQVKFEIDEQGLEKFIPPLGLQSLIEIAFEENIVSKSTPLQIEISSDGDDTLVIRHNLQPKMQGRDTGDFHRVKDIARKYELLNQSQVTISEADNKRTIILPLIKTKGLKQHEKLEEAF